VVYGQGFVSIGKGIYNIFVLQFVILLQIHKGDITMGEKFNFDFFQVPHVGVADTENIRTDVKVPIRRRKDMKVSNFGSLNIGPRMSEDYTRTYLGFQSKDELADWSRIVPQWQFAERNENPYVLGSTIKYVRDDQFIRLTMSKESGAYFDVPKFDVMDSNSVTAEGIAATTNSKIKNWPSEGWRSLGGKYDFLPYSGGALK
jgi:hypothetical protein